MLRRLWQIQATAAVLAGVSAYISLGAAQSTATVRGVVLNAVTHQPIGRVLVSLGDAGAQLTDATGHFSFDQVASGNTVIFFRRPGYFNFLGYGSGMQTLAVAADMPPVTLELAPLASLSGQVRVPDGDSAAGVRLDLYQAGAVGGWRTWQRLGTATAQPDGSFQFPALYPGSYVVHAEPSLDPAPYGTPPGTRSGYAPVFSPDAHEIALATVYTLAAGQTAEAPVQLTRMPFFPVTARLAGGDDVPFATISGNGFLGWRPRGRGDDDVLHTELPSGSYTLTLRGGFRQAGPEPATLVASEAFAVHDGPALVSGITLVRQPLLTLSVDAALPAAPGSQAANDASPSVTLQLVPVGQLTDAIYAVTSLGSGGAPGSSPVPPGTYHVSGSSSSGFLSALTAGGTDLLSQPLVIPPGAATQITATVRAETGSLAVTLGDALPPCVLYAIPLAPGAEERTEVATGTTASFSSLAPGDYLVFATAGRVAIPFREPGVLAQLDGQRVTITAGGEAQVTLRSLFAVPAGLAGAQ